MEDTIYKLTKNLKASIHCIEPIPCNPCETACPFGAITIGKDITNLPMVDADKCKGCAICLAKCPGLAIRLIDKDYSKEESIVAFPYEYLPIPEKGENVSATNILGQVVGKGIVYKVQKPLKEDPTRIIYLIVGKDIADKVHSIKKIK